MGHMAEAKATERGKSKTDAVQLLLVAREGMPLKRRSKHAACLMTLLN